MKFSVATVVCALAAVGFAAFTPTNGPTGNPISAPGLNQQIPVGQPFTITWAPTTPGPVSIILLRGPSTNVVPIAVITDSTPNTGTFVWTPSTSLENDSTHYGIQIIDQDGDFQYSTQFGIKNDNPTSSSVSSMSSSWTGPASSSSSVSLVVISSFTTVMCSSVTPTVAPSGTAPTKTPTVAPTTLLITPTPTPSAPAFKGAAGHNAVSLAGVAVAVAAVLAM